MVVAGLPDLGSWNDSNVTLVYVSGSLLLVRETTCLAELCHVGRYWIDEVDDGTQETNRCLPQNLGIRGPHIPVCVTILYRDMVR